MGSPQTRTYEMSIHLTMPPRLYSQGIRRLTAIGSPREPDTPYFCGMSIGQTNDPVAFHEFNTWRQ